MTDTRCIQYIDWLHIKIFFLSLWSKTMKWVTDVDLSRGAAVTHIHFEYFSGFLWLSVWVQYTD